MTEKVNALPPVVADKLRLYQQQIAALQAVQQAFLEGVFASLGITRPVRVDFTAMTYQVQGTEPPGEGLSA